MLALEYLKRHYTDDDRRLTIDDFDRHLTMELRLGEHMQSQIFWYGYYNRDIVMLMDKILSPNMVVVDVGGNIGEIALSAAIRVGRGGRVYSFEPIPALYDTLQYNLSRNGLGHALAVPKGLSNRAGFAKIYSSAVRGGDSTVNDGLGTLYPSRDRAVLEGEIALTTLDMFCEENDIRSIDLIKIDVEGAEFDVLKGSKTALKAFKPKLIIEIQNKSAEASGIAGEDILGYLEDLGYSFFIIGRKAKLKPLSPNHIGRFQNVLCVPT